MQAAGTCRLLTARVGPSWLRVGVGGVSSLPISAPARRSASSTARPLESPAVLSLECTSISVGSPARTLVEQLSLTIREGEVWAVLGATGCGKTTLSQLMGDRLCANVPTQKRSALFDSISFDAHQRLLQQEVMEYRESRCDSRYMRATVASFLCPHLYPEGMTMDGEGVVEFPRPRSNLSALPIRYDEPSDSPLLATLESGVSTGLVSDLLRHLGLHDQRHSPLHGLSTGEGRKLMLIKALLQPPKLLVLDEAFDGLDVRTRAELGGVLRKVYSGEGANSSVVLIAHRIEDLLIEPSHVLMLGAGEDGTAYVKGTWHEMAHSVRALFAAQQANQPKIDLSTKIVTQDDTADESIPLLEFRGVTVKYPRKTVFEGLCWTVLKGSKWVVAGANGSGKSTLLDLITGENLQGYKNDIRLFGKKKGAGVSIWEVKEKLGVVSSKLHMSYLDLCAVSSAEKRKIWSTWDVRAESAENHWAPILVVCSGFFDSIGLYAQVSHEQERIARQWIQRFNLTDLVTPPVLGTRRIDRATGKVVYDRPRVKTPVQDFGNMSFGEQKLILLCRAMVKGPPLLLLDEPTHGLSGEHRHRLLTMLGGLVADPEVTIVYISHHQDEIDHLGFPNLLQL